MNPIFGWNWSDFWTNLASTVIGVALGIPIALAIERRFERQSERKRLRKDRARLLAAVSALKLCVDLNVSSLASTENQLRAGKVPFTMTVDLFTWEAIRSEIVELIPEPVKKVTIAQFFAWLATIASLVEKHFDQSVGSPSALGSSPTTRLEIRDRILEMIPKARAVGQAIAAGLTEISDGVAASPD